MKLKIIHSIAFLFLFIVYPSLSLKAQSYNAAETQALMAFFAQNNNGNWKTAGLNNPASLTDDEKMDHLVSQDIISVDAGHVTQIKLNRGYYRPLELADFEKLEQLEVKETYISSFSIKNIPLVNIHLEANKYIMTIKIEDCDELEKVLVTPSTDLSRFESMALESIEVLNCEKLEVLDLSGKNDRPVVDESFIFNEKIEKIEIVNCPSLTDINCTGARISTINIDTPENIKRINAWKAFPINDFTVFTNLEELCGNIYAHDHHEKLPPTLKTLILPFDNSIAHLDLSFLTSLEELYLFGSDLQTLNAPQSLDLGKSDLRFNRLSNSELKKMTGNMTNEMFESYKIFPQKLNRYIQLSGMEQHPEVIELGKEMDLSAEAYGGVACTFKWYKMSIDFQSDLYRHNVLTDGSFFSLIETGIQDGELEYISNGPTFTPGNDMLKQFLLCIIEPEGYTKWDEVDPRRYYWYQAATFPELEFYLTIDGQTDKVENGGSIKIKESGDNAYLEIKWDEDYSDPLYFNKWYIYGSVNGIDFDDWGDFIYYNKRIDLSNLANGKYEIKVDSVLFFKYEQPYCHQLYNDTYTIEVGEEPEPGPEDNPPSLQYKVKIENGPYTNVRTGGMTVEKEKTDVYLGIIPDRKTGNIDYDEWKITYTGPDQKQVSTEKENSEDLYEFNPDAPHNTIGDYLYTTTRLHLYKNGLEVNKSPFTVNDPYTISIVKSNPVPDGIYLQYKVKINEGAYNDVPTGGTTIEREGTDVRLAILPVTVNRSVFFDEWEIDYIDHTGNRQSSGRVTLGELYEFNPDDPHNKTGEYPYLTYRLHLYQNGTEIENSPYILDDPYTILITDTPDSPMVEMDTLWTICPGERILNIPYKFLTNRENVEYKIVFCEESAECEFEDMKEYKPLPESDYFTIDIPEVMHPGLHRGEILFRYSTNPDLLYNYPVYIYIPIPMVITQQPVAVSNLCTTDTFALSVEVSGNPISYQWFLGTSLIAGANKSTYEAAFDETIEGEYFVEITDTCGIIYSDTVLVTGSNVWIEQKWDDVLYVYNKEGIYTSYQWYKNGNKIESYGTSQYYPEVGMSGTYTVHAFRADGSYDESCPFVTFNETKAGPPRVYPNTIRRFSQMTINAPSQGEYSVRIVNLAGNIVYSTVRNEQETQIEVTFPNGVYIVTIQTKDGKIQTDKIIVIE